MASHRIREPRRKVQLTARLRDERGWSDVTICDVSERGLSLRSAAAPDKGAFVEIRRGALSVVGQVRWSSGVRCGMRAQDRVPVEAILSPPDAIPASFPGERRAAPRTQQSVAAAPTDAASASRRFSRLFDWTCIALAAVFAAGTVANFALNTLSRPLELTGIALARSG